MNSDALWSCGSYCVVDPGPEWFNRSAAHLAQWSDPGWIGFHTPEEFRALFLAAGFAHAVSTEVLPGFCVSLGLKAADAQRRGQRQVERLLRC